MADYDSDRFRQSYAALSDEELASPAQTPDSLLPEARPVLEEELNRRGISQTQKNEVRPGPEVSQNREAQLRKRAALMRRHKIEDWFTSTAIIVMGWMVGGLVWLAARLTLGVPYGRAKALAIETGVAATIVSGLIGVVILHRRQRWQKLKSQNRRQ